MIDLCRKVWKLSAHACLLKLANLGFAINPEDRRSDVVAAYVAGKRTIQDNLHSVLTVGRQTILQKERLSGMLMRAGFMWSPTISRQHVQELGVHGCSLDQILAASNGSIAKSRFKGRGWQDVLMFPFYDLPGRLAGIDFAGRDLNKLHGDMSFCSALHGDREGGLFIRSKLLHGHGPVFAVDGAIRAVQLQLRYRSVKNDLPDLVAWRHDSAAATRSAWKMLRGRKIVFLTKEFDHRVWCQAILADALIYRVPTDAKRHISEHVELAEHQARHWTTWLSEQVGGMRDEQVEELLLQLRLNQIDAKAVVDRCPEPGRARMLKAMSFNRSFRAIPWNAYQTIEERNSQWFLLDMRRGAEQMICNASLQIDAMVAVDKLMFYRGHVQVGERRAEFFVPREEIRKNPGNWLESFVAENELGTLHYHRSFGIHLVDIAKQLNEPSVRKGFRRVGWDETKQAVITPNVGIWSNGTVEPVDILSEDGLVPATTVATEPPAVADLTRMVSYSKENLLFWASWQALVANVLAPAFGQTRYGLAVVGEKNAFAVGQAAAALGCLNLSDQSAANLLVAERDHGWPLWLNPAGSMTPKTIKKLLDGNSFGDRNLAIRTSSSVADILLVNGDFHALRLKNDQETFNLFAWEQATRLFANFTQWIFEDPKNRPGLEHGLLPGIAGATKRWLAQLYGIDTKITERSLAQLHLAGPVHGERLIKFLVDNIQAGRLSLTADRKTQMPRLLRDGDTVVIEQQELLKLCIKYNWPFFRAGAVAAQLAGCGLLSAETVVDGFLAWMVPASVFDKQLPQSGLRVVG